MQITVTFDTAAQTRAFGRRLADVLRAGDLIVLTGPLGAGKTALTQGIAAGLGVRGPVTSPTFVLARIHPPESGELPLVHVDAYRLGGAAELDELDLDADFAESVTVVEWGEGLAERLAESHLRISIEPQEALVDTDDTDEAARVLTLTEVGAGWVGRLAAL